MSKFCGLNFCGWLLICENRKHQTPRKLKCKGTCWLPRDVAGGFFPSPKPPGAMATVLTVFIMGSSDLRSSKTRNGRKGTGNGDMEWGMGIGSGEWEWEQVMGK